MNHDIKHIKVDITLAAILKVVAVVLSILLLWRISDILVLLFVVLIFVTALSPLVDTLSHQLAIKRWLAVTLIFSGVALVFILTVWLAVPLIVRQLIDLLQMPQLRNVFGTSESSSFIDELQFLSSRIPGLPTDTAGFIAFFSSIFGGIASALTVFVLTIYLLLEEDGIRKFVLSILPTNHKEQIVSTFHKISLKLGSWLRGQLLLGLLVGVFDLVVLLIFGVPYALTLAFFGGVTELIPYLGPFIGYAAALFVALTQDSNWGFSRVVVIVGISIGYLLIQQAEGHILVPKVMQRSVGLSPVVVIIAILIGANLFGLLGVVLAVPVAAALAVVADEWPAIQTAYRNNRRVINKTFQEE